MSAQPDSLASTPGPQVRPDATGPVDPSGAVVDRGDDGPRRRSRTPAAVRAVRPRQWIKNLLVLTAPLAAGDLTEPRVLLHSALAFLAFCLISSTVYLVNDVRDVAEDRLHPRKRFRPIAARELRVSAALVLAAITGVAGLAVGFATAPKLGAVLCVYLGLQLLYSGFLKHLPVIDLAMVASGFLLRAIAGGVASNLPLSQWFLLVASFGSLFMVAGKRYSELRALGADAGTRRSLERYSTSYLRFTWMLAAATVIMSYSLWAFTNPQAAFAGGPWAAVSVANLSYLIPSSPGAIGTGEAGEPEDVVLHDHVLQALGLIWLVLIVIAVYGSKVVS